jgi:quercetin dioxygenase-like cupin family protein
MSKIHVLRRVLIGAASAATISAGLAWATTGSGTQSTLLGRVTFDGFEVTRRVVVASPRAVKDQAVAQDRDRSRRGRTVWEVEVEAEPALDVATQMITFQPGGQSGWHSHPGPVFISVIEGTMTFYESDDPRCEPIVRHAGEGFLDGADEHAHIARNESGAPATNLVTYFAPPGAPLRIDAPDPGHCPF